MAKVHVGFSVDLGKLAPGTFDGVSNPQQVAEDTIKAMLFDYARSQSLTELRTAQRDTSLSKDQRATRMAMALRRSMLTLQAEANFDVTLLDEGVVLSTEHPIERVA